MAPLQTIRSSIARVPYALCTGRPQPYVELMTQLLGENAFSMPSIVESGCYLYDPKRNRMIPDAIVEESFERFQVIRETVRAKMKTYGVSIEPGKELCISLIPAGVVTVESLFVSIGKILNVLGVRDEVFLAHSNSAVDITPLGIDKGSGVRLLSQYTGISSARMLAIGDANNDLPALHAVGHVACPANASDDVKQLVRNRGGFVAAAPYGDGVVEILRFHQIIAQ
jgi:hydroxymethylpyrimidine pyrophosphatase-like HAD family hydrolase